MAGERQVMIELDQHKVTYDRLWMAVMACELDVKRSPGRQRSGPQCSREKK